MKRAVVFIGFHYHVLALFVQQQVRVVVHADTAEERIDGLHQVRDHRAGRRLSVRAGYAERFHLLRQEP